ncbi:MAG: choice-of-anchor A family protein, partial [Oscillospiraceae bacterium]|nr:choice-of-anchor A family protein [Oscillospiraceae bacterium]
MRNKKLMKMGLSAVTVVAFLIAQIAVFSVAANRIVLNEDNVYLVGPIDDGHLAVVDTFGVFVKNDFIITGSDSEGRVAVGGTFNSPNMSGYAMNDYGLFPQYASAVIGENLMGGRINVKGNPTIIEGQNSDVFCFDEYFDVLEQVSQAFSEQDLGEVGPGGWCLLFTGDNEYINFFNVSVDLWNVWSNKSVVVPNNSKVVINIIGDGVPQLRGGIELGGTSTDGRDKTHLAERILLNVVDAENALITSSVGASIFAPKSKIIGSNGHIFGQTICKEFVGAGTWNCTEFGAEIFGLDEATKLIGFEPEVPDEDDDDTTNGGDDDTTNGGDDDTTNGGDDDTTNGGGDDTTNGGDDDTTNGGDDDTTNGGDDDTTNGGDDDTTNGGDDDTTNGG